MSTASITHHPIPFATAAAAVVAVLAIGTVVAVQDNSGSTAPPTQQTNTLPHYGHQPPLHGGTTQMGMP
jgi:hypothetical protein